MSATSDKILLQDLVVRGHLGHTPEERANAQDIWMDLEMDVDMRKAAKTDDIAHAVDYMAVATKVQEVLDQGPYNLAERLANRIAGALLQSFAIQRVKVRVKKKTVPNASFAIVQVTRVSGR